MICSDRGHPRAATPVQRERVHDRQNTHSSPSLNRLSSFDRRRFLLAAGGGAAALAFTLQSPAHAGSHAPGKMDYPFTLGVASGDPLPNAVVLWTRLAPRPLAPAGGMPGNRPI